MVIWNIEKIYNDIENKIQSKNYFSVQINGIPT